MTGMSVKSNLEERVKYLVWDLRKGNLQFGKGHTDDQKIDESYQYCMVLDFGMRVPGTHYHPSVSLIPYL